MHLDQSILDYINQFEGIQREKLIELYEFIQYDFPKLKAKIAWQMPSFYDEKIIISFAANQKHLGLYPGPNAILFFQEELKTYVTTKGSIHIPYDSPLDRNLWVKIIKFNLENQGKK